jgi:hypothetical protein
VELLPWSVDVLAPGLALGLELLGLELGLAFWSGGVAVLGLELGFALWSEGLAWLELGLVLLLPEVEV